MQDSRLFQLMFGTGACPTIQLFWPLVHRLALLLTTADRLRLTIVSRDRTRPNETIIYTRVVIKSVTIEKGDVKKLIEIVLHINKPYVMTETCNCPCNKATL